jgi:hypothetical protein
MFSFEYVRACESWKNRFAFEFVVQSNLGEELFTGALSESPVRSSAGPDDNFG